MSCFTKSGSFVNKLLFPAPARPADDDLLSAVPTCIPGLQHLWVPRAVDGAAAAANTTSSSVSSSSASSSLPKAAAKPAQEASLPKTHIPCSVCHNATSSKVVLYCHGNATDLREIGSMMVALRKVLDASVVAVEYPGYGCNGSATPSERAILADVHRVYNYLVTHAGYKHENVVMFGRSIGTGVAFDVAAHYPVGGLILISAYTRISALIRLLAGRVAASVVSERFPSITKVPRVQCPVVLIHGRDDDLIPAAMSVELEAALRAHRPSRATVIRVVPGMDHNNIMGFWATDLVPTILQGFPKDAQGVSLTPRSSATAVVELQPNPDAGVKTANKRHLVNPRWQWQWAGVNAAAAAGGGAVSAGAGAGAGGAGGGAGAVSTREAASASAGAAGAAAAGAAVA